MNIKRLIAAGASAAVILGATAVPALACDWWGCGGEGSDPFTFIKNKAYVKNVVTTTADTGLNAILAEDDVTGGTITSGVAVAGADVANIVNTNVVDTCGCDGTTIIKNKAKVKNYVTTGAYTGGNLIGAGDDVTGGTIVTGDATAGSLVTNVVNTNTVGFAL